MLYSLESKMDEWTDRKNELNENKTKWQHCQHIDTKVKFPHVEKFDIFLYHILYVFFTSCQMNL